MPPPLASVDQLEAIAAALSRCGISGDHVGAYCQGAIARAPATLTADEANQIIDILRGQVTS
jgi:hypothetical protein